MYGRIFDIILLVILTQFIFGKSELRNVCKHFNYFTHV